MASEMSSYIYSWSEKDAFVVCLAVFDFYQTCIHYDYSASRTHTKCTQVLFRNQEQSL